MSHPNTHKYCRIRHLITIQDIHESKNFNSFLVTTDNGSGIYLFIYVFFWLCEFSQFCLNFVLFLWLLFMSCSL
uniref:Uncharacterized protein n=1 Tax=Anguilla anguilla TaxID=7936 RepID=A0A0E9PJD3_ANGAN